MVVITSCIKNGAIHTTHRAVGDPVTIAQELAAAIADVAVEFELAEGKTPADVIHKIADFATEFLPQALERKRASAEREA